MPILRVRASENAFADRCWWCAGSLGAKPRPGQEFCCTRHRVRWHRQAREALVKAGLIPNGKSSGISEAVSAR